MTVLAIHTLGDPILRKTAAPVDPEYLGEWDDLIRDMRDTAKKSHAVGLAAPQVGVSKRIILVKRQIIINPSIVDQDGKFKPSEGCLSIPTFHAPVYRSDFVVVEGLDDEGKPFKAAFTGVEAQAVQHEVEHLDGKLYIDRLQPLARSRIIKAWHKHFRPGVTYLPRSRAKD